MSSVEASSSVVFISFVLAALAGCGSSSSDGGTGGSGGNATSPCQMTVSGDVTDTVPCKTTYEYVQGLSVVSWDQAGLSAAKKIDIASGDIRVQDAFEQKAYADSDFARYSLDISPVSTTQLINYAAAKAVPSYADRGSMTATLSDVTTTAKGFTVHGAADATLDKTPNGGGTVTVHVDF